MHNDNTVKNVDIKMQNLYFVSLIKMHYADLRSQNFIQATSI